MHSGIDRDLLEREAARFLEIGKIMFQKDFVAANDGNLSAKVGENAYLVTPSGVSKGFMSREMLLVVDGDGAVIEGAGKPSSELAMHLRVYRENPAVGAVVHAHPTFATLYAVQCVPLDQAILAEAVVQLGCVPVAKYARPGTEEVPESVAPFCKDYNAVLLANHGALTWGDTLNRAWFRMETLEFYAKIQYLSERGRLYVKANRLTGEQLEALTGDRRKLTGSNGAGVPDHSILRLNPSCVKGDF